MREAIWAIVLLLLIPRSGSAEPAVTHVHIIGTFEPQRVEVLPGDALGWDNHGTVSHTVTDAGCMLAPPGPCAYDETVAPGGSFSRTFDRSGVFEFRCRIHGFTGRVTVADPPGVLPDLTVEQLVSADVVALGAPMPTTKRIAVTLANRGSGSAPPSSTRVQYQGARGWQTIADIQAHVMGPGQDVTINVLWQTSGKVGDFQVRAIVDHPGAIDELRETNNEQRALVPILLPPGTIAGVDLLDP